MNPLYTSFAGAHQEFGSANAEDRGGRPDLDRVGILLRDLSRNHRERSAGKRGVEYAFMRGRVESVALDLQHAVGSYRQQRVVDERDSRRTIGARNYNVGRLEVRPDVGRHALASALEVYGALRDLELGDVRCEPDDGREAKREREHESTHVD